MIFVVTWFAGLFYIVRLFIYNREAQDKPEPEKRILTQQFSIMIKRLWFGITWPSCILTFFLGTWLVLLYGGFPAWLITKIGIVLGLFLYHLSIHQIYKKQLNNIFSYTSMQLRMWNEVATLFLFAIVFLVALKDSLSFIWGVVSLIGLFIVIGTATIIYRFIRKE